MGYVQIVVDALPAKVSSLVEKFNYFTQQPVSLDSGHGNVIEFLTESAIKF